ncbi:hypothetical protein A3A38_01595 [Candidatus Kaiserbacteria bacterium RIFCSPLOWO2_01_FULL_53_17]|uniref:Toxin n=1 Tax=Candidatus Kaiserbacteria bacterium RIFCSPLOWO2_01_FULL_53_17 TaxID=1798511 RepID=A0A1F6EGV6_9BACT|nr:MAG: hypothetical protein A3A38_01595 [Candidatus Kaiserbacteria bacterium RIFCSPLOWO2_01_FULL_53_17]
MRIRADIIGFEWDDGNRDKSLKKHGIPQDACEEVFQDEKRQVYPDLRHSQNEVRNIIVGKTKQGLLLVVTFTLRRGRIRIISARPINRKEKKLYE